MDRLLHIFVDDCHGHPVGGAQVEFSVNGEVLGHVVTRAGQATMQMPGPRQAVDIRVTFKDDKNKSHEETAKVAANQDSLRISLDYDSGTGRPTTFDRVTGLIAFVLLSGLTGFLLIYEPPASAAYPVTVYIGICSGIIATSLIGGFLRLETNINGIGIRAAGGLAAAVFVIWMDPGSRVLPQPHAFTETYGRVFGAYEVWALLRLMDNFNGEELSKETILAAAEGSNSELARSLQLSSSLCADGQNLEATETAILPEIDFENAHSLGCTFLASLELVKTFGEKWPYLNARTVRTPLFKGMTAPVTDEGPSLPLTLAYTATVEKPFDVLCLSADLFHSDNQRPLPDKWACPDRSTRSVGFLFLILENTSELHFNKLKIKTRPYDFDEKTLRSAPLTRVLYAEPLVKRELPENYAWECSDILESAGCRDIFESYLLSMFDMPRPESAQLKYEDIECFRKGCRSTGSYTVGRIRPGDAIFLLLAAYKADDNGFEDYYMSDVIVPVSLEYEIGDQIVVQRIRPPLRDAGSDSRTEFAGSRGWIGQ